MDKIFNVIIEKDTDGFYVSSVPALKGCHTQAKSLDELIERTKEVILNAGWIAFEKGVGQIFFHCTGLLLG